MGEYASRAWCHQTLGRDVVNFHNQKEREIFRYYHRVKFLIDRYRRLLLLGVVSLIATDLAGIALPWLIKGGIDTALRAKDSNASLLTYPLLILGAASL